MNGNPMAQPDYEELGVIADSLLEECDEDTALLAERIDDLPQQVRIGLLASDFLNAYQVFYYFFRIRPEEIEMERLILLPASELQYGIRINEIELLDLIFAVIQGEPNILVSDGDNVVARYAGMNAYKDALTYIESTL
jgi:hypothetical protein